MEQHHLRSGVPKPIKSAPFARILGWMGQIALGHGR